VRPQGWTGTRGWTPGRLLVVGLVVFLIVVAARGLYVFPRLVGPTEDIRHGARSVTAPVANRSTFPDYRDTVWLPVRDLVSGGNPYDAVAYLDRHPYAFEFSYSPAQLTIFLPLGLLPWTVSASVWFVALVVASLALVGCALALARLPRRVDLLLALTAAVLLLRPMALMLTLGQTSILPLIATAVALGRPRNDWVTTVCVAITWLKPQFGIPVSALLLTAGLWRPVLKGVALSLLVALPTLAWAVVNAGGVRAFVSSVLSAPGAALGERVGNYVTPDLASLVGRVTGTQTSAAVVGVCFLVVTGVGALAVGRYTGRGATERAGVYVCAVTTVLLALPHGEYDLALLVPASALALIVVLGEDLVRRRFALATVLLIGLALVPRGEQGYSLREIEITVLVLVATALVVRSSSGGRLGLAPLAVGVGAFLVLRYAVDATLGWDATGLGLLPTVCVLACWLVSLGWLTVGSLRAGARTAVEV